MLPLFAFLFASCAVCALLGRHLLRPRPLPGIPVLPGAIPVFGHGLALLRHIREKDSVFGWFVEVVERSERPRIAQVFLGREPLILISDAEQIDRVYASPDWDKAESKLVAQLSPLGLVGRQTDAMVKAHQRVFAYSHSSAFIALAGTHFSAHFDLLVAQWSTVANAGAFFPVAEDLKRLMTDLIARATFGESFRQTATGQSHEVAEGIEYLFQSLRGGALSTLRNWLLRHSPTYRRHLRIVDKYIASRIDRARAGIVNGDEVAEIECMIDIKMARESRNGPESAMPACELRDELLTTMIAGGETSTSAQLWALKILSENPAVQHKLHAELVCVLPLPDERPPTAAEVSATATPYLEAVVHEILRLEGVGVLIKKQAIRDTTLLGPSPDKKPVVVPAGTNVVLLAAYAALHTVPDGHLFRPERWLDPKTGAFDVRRAWSVPFGAGPRMCYGYKMALVVLRLFVAQLSLAYFVRPLPDELRTDQAIDHVTRRPARNYVGFRKWEDVPTEIGTVGGE